MTKNDHIAWLKKQLAHYEQDLARAEADIERLRPIVINVRSTIEALAGRSGGNGAKSEEKKDPAGPIGTRTLKRNPEFESLSTTAAVKKILDSSLQPLHHDELARRIFAIGKDSDLIKAKRSLSSQLSSGAQKRYWTALGGGRYARGESGT